MEIKDPFLGLFSSVNNKYLTIYKEWCRVKVSKEFHRIGCNSVHYPIRKEEVFMMKELKPIKEVTQIDLDSYMWTTQIRREL